METPKPQNPKTPKPRLINLSFNLNEKISEKESLQLLYRLVLLDVSPQYNIASALLIKEWSVCIDILLQREY